MTAPKRAAAGRRKAREWIIAGTQTSEQVVCGPVLKDGERITVREVLPKKPSRGAKGKK